MFLLCLEKTAFDSGDDEVLETCSSNANLSEKSVRQCMEGKLGRPLRVCAQLGPLHYKSTCPDGILSILTGHLREQYALHLPMCIYTVSVHHKLRLPQHATSLQLRAACRRAAGSGSWAGNASPSVCALDPGGGCSLG